MNMISIAIICHGPCIHYLEDHLGAIAEAQRQSGIKDLPVGVVVSQLITQDQMDKCESAIRKSGLSVKSYYCSEKLNLATARKISANLTNSDWVLFTDVDTIMDKHALANYSDNIRSVKDDVGAVSGGIGVWHQSEYGGYEALWEILTLYRRINPAFEKKICESLDKDWRNHLNSINSKALEWMGSSRNTEVKFLQGYNMLVRRDLLKDDAFQEHLAGVWDRALAAQITGPMTLKILCWPDCLVYHDFNFPLEQIQQRKISHAIHTNRVRKAFSGYDNVSGPHDASQWLLDVDTYHPSCPNRDLFPFNTESGRTYAAAAKIAYAYGTLRSLVEQEISAPTPLRDHRIILTSPLSVPSA